MKINFWAVACGIILANVVILFAIIFKDTQITNYNSIANKKTPNIHVEFDTFNPPPTFEQQTNKFNNLTKKISEKSGIYSLYIKNLNTNETLIYGEDDIYFGASLYKIPISHALVLELESGDIGLEDKAEYRASDFFGGSGKIQEILNTQTTFTINELLNYLLKDSDNIAQTMLERTLGEEKIKESFSNLTAGQKQDFYNENLLNVVEMGEIFEYLYNYEQEVKPKFSIFETMKQTSFDDRIHAGFGDGFNGDFAHKIGNWAQNGTWHDCGILYSGNNVYSVCLMSKRTTYEEFIEIAKEIGVLLSEF